MPLPDRREWLVEILTQAIAFDADPEATADAILATLYPETYPREVLLPDDPTGGLAG